MSKLFVVLLVIVLLFTMSSCSGYNTIMFEHLSNEEHYHTVGATFVSYAEADNCIYLDVVVENISDFDPSAEEDAETIIKGG